MPRLLPALAISSLSIATLALGALASPALAAGDPVKGEQVFKRCMTCHTTAQGAPNKVGPNLFGVVGAQAGHVEGFRYSDAMKGSGLTWDEATLDAYLTKPRELIPGNKMAFVGLPKEQDRADVIAYLSTLK
ncbi:c-type cytochrome [Zavarzinia sp. CC-PAN008]|uniref:c-type cytochrome n=1 Tax=Zavarzinia sp. CC-PAN008 TaxID=3243332 RepID=UPI003F748539